MQPSDDDIRAMLDAATPGPWRIAGEKTIRTDSRWIAKANWDNGRANAPLLAAAPDLAALALSRGVALAKAAAENARLLEALRNIREAITDSDDCAALALIDTAIRGDDA